MYRGSFYSRRVVEKCKRWLRRLEQSSNYSDVSSNNEEENDNVQHMQYSAPTNNIFSTITNDLHDDDDYHDDEYDNTETPSDVEHDFRDQSPPLYDGSTISAKKAMKLLMDLLISDVNLDKKNILDLFKLIKFILPQPNTLPVTWKSIMKLFGRANLFTTIFLCSLCHRRCGKTTFSTKLCKNEACSPSGLTLKTNEMIELVNLDVRTQLKTIVSRNIKLLSKNTDYFPKSDISTGAFYQTTISESKCKTITFVLHTDGAPLIRTSKQSIWPLFASIVEIPPPIREYQKNIVLLALWSSKSKSDVNVFLKHTVYVFSFFEFSFIIRIIVVIDHIITRECFLVFCRNEIKILMDDGTSISVNNMEFKFVIRNS